jgi:phage-related protein
MSFNVSYVFQAVDQFSPVTKGMQAELDRMAASVEKMSTKMSDMGNKLKETGKSMALGVTAPIVAVGGLSLKAAAEKEKITRQLEGIVGDVEKVAALDKQLEAIELQSPIDPAAFDQAALRLLTMGVSIEKIAPTLENFAKISAGTGIEVATLTEYFAVAQSGSQGMSRALIALNRQVPVLAEMQKIFKERFNIDVTTKELQAMAAEGKIGMDLLEESFARLTAEGGKFADANLKMSQTFAGASQMLRNNFDRFLEALGFAILGSVDLDGVILSLNEKLKSLVTFIENFAQQNPKLTKFIVIFLAIAAAIAPVLVGLGYAVMGIAALAKGFLFFATPVGLIIAAVTAFAAIALYLYNTLGFLASAVFVVGGALLLLYKYNLLATAATLSAVLAGVRTAVLLFNLALAANPIGLIITAVAALAAGLVYLMSRFGLFDGIIDSVMSKIMALIGAIKQIFSFDFGKIGSAIGGVFGFGDKNVTVEAPEINVPTPQVNVASPQVNVPTPQINAPTPSAINTAPTLMNEQPLINNNVSIGAQTMQTETRSQVDINLKGNTDAVRSVQSNGDRNTNVNVSQNMGYGGY